jgi:hypothetical protein
MEESQVGIRYLKQNIKKVKNHQGLLTEFSSTVKKGMQ